MILAAGTNVCKKYVPGLGVEVPEYSIMGVRGKERGGQDYV